MFEQLHARAFPPAAGFDAIEATASDDDGAPRSDAPIDWAAGRRALGAAVADGADPLRMALLAFNLALGRSSEPFSWRRRGEQLRRAVSRGDRFADHGRGVPGAGFERLLDMLEDAGQVEQLLVADRRERPLTLAWFIVRLDGETRGWRHRARHDAGACPGCAPDGRCRDRKRYHPRADELAERRAARERWRAKSVVAASMPEPGAC